MPRVSVLLTSYNKPAMLAEAIESVLAQTYRDFELIVLEDNSPDPGVLETLTRYWRQPQVSVYKSDVSAEERPRRVRYAVLANVGLQLARGQYITYLCDDDLYRSRRLEAMVARLERGDCRVVYGGQEVVRDGQVVELRAASRVLLQASGVVDHSSVMHARQAGLEVGGWDDDPRHWGWADAVFWDRLTAAGHLFHPVAMPEVLDVHRVHAGSVSARMQRQQMPWGP